jgi:MFS family permease
MNLLPKSGFTLTPRLAISLIFLMRGIILGSWFPRIPGIVEKLDIPSSQLGLVWFSAAACNILAFSIAARLVRRFGTATTQLFFAIPYPVVYTLAGFAPTFPLFWLAMLGTGLAGGGYDISTSVQGGIVERATKRPLVSALYGYFSLGALIGSFSSGLIAQAGIAMGVQFAVISAIAIPATLILRTGLLPDEKRPAAPAAKRRRFALPSKALLPLGITIICVALGEETINNWVALYMRSDLGSGPAIAGFAYTAFAIATFTGRIFGDKVISRIGVDRVISAGSVMAAGGVAFGIIVNEPWSMVVGYTVVGAGLSVMVPVTYRRAGETPGMSPADAVSQVASIGFLGFMVGPILIGLLSDLFSLRLVLAIVAVSLLGIVAMVRLNPSGEQVTVQDRAPRTRPRARWRSRKSTMTSKTTPGSA